MYFSYFYAFLIIGFSIVPNVFFTLWPLFGIYWIMFFLIVFFISIMVEKMHMRYSFKHSTYAIARTVMQLVNTL